MVRRVGFSDGFDHYVGLAAGNGGLNSAWIHWSPTGEGADGSLQVGLGGQGRCFYANSNTFNYTKTRMCEGSDSDVLASLAFTLKLSRLDTTTSLIMFGIMGSTGDVQMQLVFNPIGKVLVTGEGGVTLHTTDFAFAVGVEYRCAMTIDMTVADATVINLWANGEQIITDITADFQDAAVQNVGGVRIYGHSSYNNTDASQCYWDDIFMLLGTIENLGQVALYLAGPTADVVHNWTHSEGATGFGVVDEKPMNLTDYNSSATVGLRDLFSFADLTRVPDSILCITQVTGTSKEESGARQIQNVLKVGGVTDAIAPAFNESQTYQFAMSHWLVNPVSGIAWTVADYNALQSGYEDAA